MISEKEIRSVFLELLQKVEVCFRTPSNQKSVEVCELVDGAKNKLLAMNEVNERKPKWD